MKSVTKSVTKTITKKLILLFLSVMILGMPLLSAPSALSEESGDSFTLTYQDIRGNGSWEATGYPDIWITPIFDEHIVMGKEDYPANFLKFPAPEGAAPIEFSYDSASFINFDTLVGYYYNAYDRYSFEVFLEDIDESAILSDGSDGLAIYVPEDSRRAYGLLDIKAQFGKTAKLHIMLYDNTGKMTTEEKGELIKSEMQRVQDTMALIELDHYWSQDKFTSVELYMSSDPITAIINTSGLIPTRFDSDSVIMLSKINDRSATKTEISLETYSYPASKGESELSKITLPDGREGVVYLSSISHLSVPVAQGKRDTIYLNISINCEESEFVDLATEAYGLVQLKGIEGIEGIE